jgi:hypothetical protein
MSSLGDFHRRANGIGRPADTNRLLDALPEKVINNMMAEERVRIEAGERIDRLHSLPTGAGL